MSLPAAAKPFWRSRNWWIAQGISSALIAADAYSTVSGLQRCPQCGDAFPFFNVHSTGSIAGAALLDLALSTGGHIAEYHYANQSPHAAVRIFGSYLQPGIDAVEHGWAINLNLNLHVQCTQAGLRC